MKHLKTLNKGVSMKFIIKWFKDWWPILVPVIIFLILLLVLFIVDPEWLPEDFWKASNMTNNNLRRW